MEENTVENLPKQQLVRPRTTEEQKIVSMVQDIIDYYIVHYYPSRFEIIKAKHLFSGDETIKIRETLGSPALNCHRHGLMDAVTDAFIKELIGENLTPKAIPLHPNKREYSDDANDAYDRMFHRSKFEADVAEKAYSEAAIIGDSYVFFGKKQEGKYQIPTANHISFWEMFVEPMADSFESSRSRVVRKIMSVDDIINKYGSAVDFNGDSGVEDLTLKEFMLATIDSAIYKSDFKKIRDIAFYQDYYMDLIRDCCNDVDSNNRREARRTYFESGKVYEDLFGIDPENKLVEMIEVWTKETDGFSVKIMVNGYLLDIPEIKFGNDPFGNIYFEESIGSPVHRGIGHKLMVKQRECDMLLFSLNNGIKMHIFPDWIADGGVQDSSGSQISQLTWTGSQTVYKNGKNNIQGKQPFRAIEYIGQDVLNLVRVRLQETVSTAFQEIGINSYIMGGDGRVERISGAFRERVQQSRARLKTIKKSISHSLNKSYYFWLTELDKKFTKKLLEKIDDDGNLYLADLNVSDINNNFEILISSEGYREETLKDAGQNVLNILNSFGSLLVDESGQIEFDKKDFASAVANSYGLEPPKMLSSEEKLRNFQKQLELELEKEKMKIEFQKRLQALNPQQAQQQQAQQQGISIEQIQQQIDQLVAQGADPQQVRLQLLQQGVPEQVISQIQFDEFVIADQNGQVMGTQVESSL